MNPAPVFLLTGTPGSGKSSVSRVLLQTFEFGLHLPVDDLREFVVSGIAHPIPGTSETARQFRLARAAAVNSAKLYARQGFAVVIDDVIFPDDAAPLEAELAAEFRVHKILLRPRLEVALERNATRDNKYFETSVLVPVIRELYQNMNPEAYRSAGWHLIDSSEHDVRTTVNQILELQNSTPV
jgi:chloramphenicol 3-O-phosphotransferase